MSNDTVRPPITTAVDPSALVQPQARRSAGGHLNTKLDVVVAEVTVDGKTFKTRTYDGMIPGPTLVLRQGDKLRIKFRNKLEGLSDGPPHAHQGGHSANGPSHFNTTNLHTHGLNVSPEGAGDFVLREIKPDASFDYEFDIPEDQAPGTYFYHAHRHGSTAIQVMGGLAGALIVKGDLDEVPEIKQAKDLVMMLQEIVVTPDEGGGWKLQDNYDLLMIHLPDSPDQHLFAINGKVRPTIRMRPGEVQRWRLIHAGFHNILPIRLEGHSLHMIGFDGVALPRIREIRPDTPAMIGQTPEDPDAAMRMSPGNRWDVLVRAGQPGTYQLKALAYGDLIQPADEMVLATVIVEGAPVEMDLPESLPAPEDPTHIADEEITARRSMTISVIPPLQPPPPGTMAMPDFVLNGQLMDHDRMDYTIPLGSVEEWLIANHDVTEHPFHMHVGSYEVTEINRVKVEEADRYFQDVFIVPKARTEQVTLPTGETITEHVPGTIRLRRRFDRFTGRYVIHCHILTHEDMGMMTLARVTDGNDGDGGH